MSETTNTPRLLPAAKEFNIGKETLIDFLQKKGFEVDLKPTSKLTPEMYYALQEEFAKDKAAKRKSEAIDLPKGVSLDNLNKSDEDLDLGVKDKVEVKKSSTKKVKPEPETTTEEPAPKEETESTATPVSSFKPVTLDKETEEILKKNIGTKAEQESSEPKEVEQKETAPEVKEVVEVEQPKPQEAEKEIPAEPVTPTVESVKKEPKPEVIVTEKTEEVKAEASIDKDTIEISDNTQKEEPVVEHIETEVPVLKGPKIIDKIDLDSINMSTRPAKGNSKKKKDEELKKSEHKPMPKAVEKVDNIEAKETPVAQTNKAKEEKEETPIAQTPKVEEVKKETPTAEPVADDKPEHIELNVPRLAGPKILGKIELPVRNDNRSGNNKEKRKRKRIPVDKAPQGNNANNNNNDANKPKQGEHQDRNKTQHNKPQGQGGQRNDNRQQGNFRPGGGQGNRNDRRNNQHNNRRNTQHQAPQEVDAKAIQDKIKETQAKLAGGVNAKLNKAKYRKTKREDMAERRAAAEMEEDNKPLQLTEFISVSELATLLDVPFTDVISKCMSLGIMVSINQRLDAEVIELVAGEFNREVEFINLQQDSDEEIDEDEGLEDIEERAPVVTIMGHVDHGKTSLLDYIRNASVVAGEAGGITQHIGAYKVTTKNGKKVAFLDTPGHEAFTAMRARGAKAADIAIIVVAADDAIMPQTREAISHAQAAGLPMVFAINKIDKEAANPEKIKEQLSAMNILVEDWGGKFQSQEISAKKGIGIEELLEKILLEAELLELKANPEKLGVGSVIEASLDKGRGYVSTVLVQNGTLNAGDIIVSGPFYGKVKAMFNERGSRIKTAGPSTPVQVLGLNGAPQAGEKFKVYNSESDAKATANRRAQLLREQGIRTRKHITLDEIGRRLALGNFKELNVIIKGDVDGSVEALSDSLQKLSTEEILVSIVHKGVGQITESDVLLASASDAIIIGFQVRPSSHAAKVADQENIEIRYYSIIYDAINEIKSAMEGMLEPTIENKVVGNIEVREVYKISGVGTIAGCYVLDGKFSRNTKLNLIRDGIVIHHGELSSLKRYKDDVKEVNAGYECGLSIKNYNDIQIGDIIEGYEEVEIKRTLK